MNFLTISAIFFMAVMLFVGVVATKKIKNTDDFFVAGRKTSQLVITSTLIASEIGGGAMIASVGLGYSAGWGGTLWYMAPFGIGAILFALLFAKKVKEEGDKYRYQSMFEWLEGRFGGYIPIRLVGGFIMLVGLFGAMAAQYVAMGTALNIIAGISVNSGAILGGIVLIIYSSLGGLYAVMWTDVLQMFIFIFGMLVLLPVLLVKAGGIGAIIAATPANYWHFFPYSALSSLTIGTTMIIAPFVREYYYQRMFASKSFKVARNSTLTQSLALFLCPVWAALVGMSVYKLNPALTKPESALPWAIANTVSPIVGAIVLGAVIAAIMSTADTFLNAGSLTFMRNIYEIIRPNVKEETKLNLAKIVTVLIGVGSLIVAVFSSSVISAIQRAWSILGGGLFVPIVVSYYWKKSTKEGVLISMIAGLATAFFLLIVKTPVPSIFGGLGASLIGLVIGSIATSGKGKKQTSKAAVE